MAFGIFSRNSSAVTINYENIPGCGLLAYLAIVVAGGALASMAAFTQVDALAVCMILSGAGLALFGLIWEGSLQELVPTEA